MGATARGLAMFCFLSFDILCEVSGKTFKVQADWAPTERRTTLRNENLSRDGKAKGETGTVHRKPRRKGKLTV